MSKSQMKREMDKLNQEFIDDLEKSTGQKVGIPVTSGQRFIKITKEK